MSDRPVVGDVGEDLYASLQLGEAETMTYADADNDWALLWYCGGIGASMEKVWDLVQADEEYDGWVRMLDPDTSPSYTLGYLAQFAGVALEPLWTDQERRDAIKTPNGFRRGTIAAMRAAIQRTLTGAKDVFFLERSGGSAYELTVNTIENQTPDEAASYAAALSQKPAGIILLFNVAGTRPYSDVDADHATYTSLETEGTYKDVRTEEP